MKFCTRCGTALTDGAAFCGSCGQPVAQAAAAPAPPTPAPPTPAPPAPAAPAPVPAPVPASAPVVPPAASTPPLGTPVDFGALASKILTGNWIGSAAVASVTLVSALVLGLIVTVARQKGGNAGTAIWGGLEQGLAALGVPIHITGGGDTATSFSVPLTLSVIVFGLGTAMFLQMTRAYPTRGAVLAEALRAASVLLVLTTVLGVLLKIVDPKVSTESTSFDQFDSRGPTLGDPLAVVRGYSAHGTPNLAGTIFLPAVILAVVLVLVAGARTYHRADRTDVVHQYLLPALAGLRVVLLSIPVIGLIPIISIATAGNDNNRWVDWVDRVVGLPNYGLMALGEGLGGKFGAYYGNQDLAYRVSKLADELNWVIWLTIPAAIGIVVLGALAAARVNTRVSPLWTIATYTTTVLASVPLLVLFANTRLTGESEDGNETYRLGVDGTALTFTFWGASILAVVLALVFLGKLRLNHLQQTPPAAPPAGPPPPAPPA